MTFAGRVARTSAVAAALVAASTALATAPAFAQDRTPGTGTAHASVSPHTAADYWDGRIYLYYSLDWNSSYSAYEGWVSDFRSYTFTAPGIGYGKGVKNNVNRATNHDQFNTARIYYNENYNASGSAPYDDFHPGESGQLIPSVRNNNASLSWYQ